MSMFSAHDVWQAYSEGRLTEAQVEAALARLDDARTPVRRKSVRVGTEAGSGFWRATSRKIVKRIALAAKKFELAHRKPGQRSGPLGHVALEVLDFLSNLVDYRTGRLDPSIETLMSRLRRSKDAIVRALAALRSAGFLDWLRRYAPTGAVGRGPQVRQASNAYRVLMPAAAERLLAAVAPESADLAADRDTRRAWSDEMRASLPIREQLAADFGAQSRLGEALADLGGAVAVRGTSGC